TGRSKRIPKRSALDPRTEKALQSSARKLPDRTLASEGPHLGSAHKKGFAIKREEAPRPNACLRSKPHETAYISYFIYGAFSLSLGTELRTIMSEENKKQSTYSADNIQVLEGLEAVRKRPSMYIGDTGVKGLHHLVYEVVDNSIDEAVAGYADDIYVTIHKDNSITVEDNGRGIPTGINKKENKSALELVMTVLHAGGKFDKDTYKVSGGLHGVGVSCVNALSTVLIAEVHREGKVFMQEYHRGKPQYEVKTVGDSDRTGTKVTFHPDPEIFTTTTVYNYDTLAGRLRELAFLNKGVRLTLMDEREEQE